jgi:hypothetical protein
LTERDAHGPGADLATGQSGAVDNAARAIGAICSLMAFLLKHLDPEEPVTVDGRHRDARGAPA